MDRYEKTKSEPESLPEGLTLRALRVADTEQYASLGLRRIDLTVFSDNAPAIALYRKFGFVEEGFSRGFALRDGMLADVLHMARLVDAPQPQTN